MPSVPSVLVVDDDAAQRRLLTSALGARCRVTAASSAEQALERIAQSPFDLLILDIEMPGMSGLELLEEVRRSHPAQRCVVVSGALGEERASWLAARGVPYLLKPYRIRALVDLVAATLSGEEGRGAADRTPGA